MENPGRFGLVAAFALALLVALALPSGAQQGGACQLDGTANFSPPLSNTQGNFTYDFGGTLSGCQSNVAGAPTQGRVEAGKVYVAPTGQQFQEPRATGNGTCASGTTQGTSISFWADGTASVVSYTTTAVTGAVDLTGTVIPSVTLPAINPLPGQPTSFTITSTRYLSDDAQGVLAFQADPTACAGAGVTSAHISGVVGLGHAS